MQFKDICRQKYSFSYDLEEYIRPKLMARRNLLPPAQKTDKKAADHLKELLDTRAHAQEDIEGFP